MTTLHLPAVDATRVHGWLAVLGATRVLAEQWPTLTLHFDPDQWYPILTNGPASAEQAADAIHAATLGAIPRGGVLPGVAADYPPPGKGWWRHADKPTVIYRPWTGDDAERWQGAMVTPTGLLHPLLSPHAAQAVRGMIAAAGRALAQQPDLLLRALAGPGIGLSPDYKVGLWLTTSYSVGQDAPHMASPGRDWLALMSLPWTPAVDDPAYGPPGEPPYRRTAPGWRWRQGRTGVRLVYDWWLWTTPVPAAAVPVLLTAPQFLPGRTIRFGAHRPRGGPQAPPKLVDFTRAEIDAGALDDVRLYSVEEVAHLAGVQPKTLRSYVSRGQCPGPDSTDDLGRRCWTAATIEPWLTRAKRPGTRTDLRRSAV